MSKAASMNILEELHASVAKKLKEIIKGDPSPQDLAQAIKFLKDNNIEPARDVENSALKALADEIGQLAPEQAGEYLN
ncbi:MAG: hypothetical protein MK081_13465 [Flavobacteriales bacterium]|nr:hypothetical protein [Flavobacteriales bacterium]